MVDWIWAIDNEPDNVFQSLATPYKGDPSVLAAQIFRNHDA
jgi:hypothetical protein